MFTFALNAAHYKTFNIILLFFNYENFHSFESEKKLTHVCFVINSSADFEFSARKNICYEQIEKEKKSLNITQQIFLCSLCSSFYNNKKKMLFSSFLIFKQNYMFVRNTQKNAFISYAISQKKANCLISTEC